MAPRVLICGAIAWAHQELRELLGPLAEIVYLDSPDRKSFLSEFRPGGRYENTVAIYRDNGSSEKIGAFDTDLVTGLPSSVSWIAHNGAGYDSIDVRACKRKGIRVSNTPAAADDSTATTALYLMLATFRHFTLAEHSLRKHDWKPKEISLKTRDVTGKTLAILGLGGIGMRFAVLAHAFPMRVIYHARKKNYSAPEYCDYFEHVEEMLRQADVLSIHVPLTSQTVGLVGERWIRMLKPGSIIINTARGKVVDEEAMIRALVDEHLSAVGLDVFPNEPEVDPRLLEMRNVTLLPHMGTETPDAQKGMEVRALTNLKCFLTTGMGKDMVAEYNVKPKL